MEVSSAVALVNQVIYKPGWTISATDHTKRFEGAIKVRIGYPARNSNRDQALGEDRYPEEITTYAEFPVIVKDCDDQALYGKLLDLITITEQHEAREFLRVEPTGWAPFHPHRVDGMRAWATRCGTDVLDDLQFGIA